MAKNDKSSCPIKKTLRLFEGKYSSSILHELIEGRKRFSDLLNNIPGISSKTLNDKLKYYVSNGIVTRQAYPEVPPRVEYDLTAKGRSLRVIIDEMYRFGSSDEVSNQSQDKDDGTAQTGS